MADKYTEQLGKDAASPIVLKRTLQMLLERIVLLEKQVKELQNGA